jgi:hypothetical protein
VTKVSAAFTHICEQYSVTLNREEDQQTFLGMRWDYANRSVSLGEKSRTKLLQEISRRMQASHIVSLYGRLFFAAEVLELPLQHYYYAIKFYRKLMWKIQRDLITPDLEVEFWDAAWRQVLDWQQKATMIEAEVKLEGHSTLLPRVDVYTDASDTGFGIVVLMEGRYYERAGRWTEERWWKKSSWMPHINQRELATVGLAETFLDELGMDVASAHLHVDNTSTLGTLKRGRSKSYWMNNILRGQNNKWRTREFVASESNLADEPSRR